MTCAEIMRPDPITVKVDQPLSKAIEVLESHHFRSVPVVDDEGKMIGQFGIHALLRLLVPKIATMDKGLERMPFVTDHMDDLRRRLADETDLPVGQFIEHDHILLHPDTPLTRVVLGLYHSHDNLPVVDPETGKLVGIVSYWDIVRELLREGTQESEA